MDNIEYLEQLIDTYMKENDAPTPEGLKNYLMAIRKNLSPGSMETSSASKGKAIQKSLGTGNVTGGLNMYPEYQDKDEGFLFNQQGITNFFSLALITFSFSILFIIISLFIY